ncbi:MAG TPA: serine/threonine-protein kinase [Gemmataceae bacterium]|nr:serine/threonine-protein kinase [Gemmataceae bacterium]
MSGSTMTQPSPRVDAREFLEHIVTSGLMDRDEVTRALESLPATDKAKTIARHLVDAGKLTRFQAERLLIGVTDGFILGQYRVLEELGRGAMGRVYKAVHQTMGRFVALKVLAPELIRTEKARDLFQREVKAAARLNHPNIVTAFDAYLSGDRYFLVMEYVDGPNLSQLVKEQGSLPVEQACEYIRQTAVGLDYAHQLGLIHRDIKPSNLLVQQTTSGPQVKMLDFGLALVSAGESGDNVFGVGTTNTVLGTPDYVSPEQARDQYDVDGRSDLYSLGCTFYYLLTGVTPFAGGSGIEKLMRHGSEPPIPVRNKRADVPEAVAAIVHKLLEKDPKDRYQTAGALAAELASVVGKKADWSAPARSRPKVRPEGGVSLASSSEDPWENVELDDQPSASTIPTAAMSTRETPAPRRPNPRRKKAIWPFVLLAALLAFGVVAGVGLAVRYLVNHIAQ